jgi:cytochrome P450
MTDQRYPRGPSMLRALRGLKDMAGGRNLSALPVFFADLAQRYGGIAHWQILGRHFFFLDEPAFIEEALVGRARDYKKGRGIERLKRLLGNGLLSSESPLHLRRRRLIQPAFHKEKIAGYGRVMVELAAQEMAGWPDDSTFDVGAQMTRLTLAIAARTLFGADIGDQAETIRSALTSALETFPASMSRFGALLDRLPMLPVVRRFMKARAQLDAVIYALIAARRADASGVHDDLLAMLLAAGDGAGALDDVAIRDEAMTLFIAGHETTANVLAWTWYLLARHPAVADRLGRELDAVLGGRLPTAADLPQLRYTHAIMAEAMRLYPPAWILGRRAIRPTTLGPYTVPRGSIVITSPLITQRNPRFWDDGQAFAPERWTDSAAQPRFAYFPFGGGNRRCIGESFAWMEGCLVIATLAQRYRFWTIDANTVEVEPLVTLRPRSPIRLRVTRRQPAATAR